MKRFLLLSVPGFLSGITAFAQLAGYTYIKPITVSNSSTSTAIGYQLKVTVNTQSLISASQMQTSGADIRFGKTCNGSTLYNYWIESGINTAATVFWVKLDTLAAGETKTFFMFYGNASATAVSDLANVFVGPNSSTDSVANGTAGGVTNSQRGFRFSANEDVLVTAFGKREPTGTTRYVTLFDFATQAILVQQQISGPAAQYSYGNLANPVWLTQGTQYLLELYQGASDGYYFGSSSQIGQHLTYYDMRYCNSCTQNTFPTNSLGNIHYGTPDLWYWTKTTLSPAPGYTVDQAPVLAIAQSTTSVCPLEAVSFTASSSMPSVTFSWQPANTSGHTLAINPAATAVYSVMAFSPGCMYTINGTATISVNPVPAITITGNTPICGTGTNVLTAAGAATYTWDSGAQSASVSVSPLGTSVYSLTGTSALGCTNTAMATVTVNTIPTVAINGGNTAICEGTQANIIVSGASSYTWSTGSNAAFISVSPLIATDYTVAFSSPEGCTNTAVTSVSVNPNPTISVAVSDAAICEGDSTVLTVSGALSYTWSSGAVTTSVITEYPLSNITYSVLGENAEGCLTLAASSITVYPLPVVFAVVSSPTLCAGSSVSVTVSGAANYSLNSVSTPSVFSVPPPIGATQYTLLGASAEGCTSTAVFNSTVYALPSVSITGGPLKVCAGDSVQLTALGAASYSWNTGANSATLVTTPGATIAYTVTGISAQGCADTAAQSVSVNPLPGVTVNSSQNVICAGETVTLTASGADTYSWTGALPGASFVVSPTATAVYTVTGTSSITACSLQVMLTQSVSLCTGLENLQANLATLVFPNPTSGRFTLKSGTGGLVSICNSQGQLVYSQKHSAGNSEINIAHLSPGIYFLNQGAYQVKVVKE